MDNIEKIKVTLEWLEEHYAKANEELFNGELGKCMFEIKPIGTRTLGQFHIEGDYGRLCVERYSRRMYIADGYGDVVEYINKKNFVVLCNPAIYMNSNYAGTELSLYTTLVHEMCHYYTYMYGCCPKQAHGVEFRNIAMLVSFKSSGVFNIQRLASAEEMKGYELDDEIKQQVDKRNESKFNRLNYIIVKKNNGEIRLSNIRNRVLISKIISLHDKNGEKVYELLNHDIAKELYNKGYRIEMRTYRFWKLSPENEFIKQIFSNPDNYKILTDDFLMENTMNEKIENDAIEINGNMDLGQHSPLELTNESNVIRLNESLLKKIIKEEILRYINKIR